MHAAAQRRGLGSGQDATPTLPVEWLSERSYRHRPPQMDRPYREAASKGDKGTLAALRRMGVPWGNPSLLVYAVLDWGCEVLVLRPYQPTCTSPAV